MQKMYQLFALQSNWKRIVGLIQAKKRPWSEPDLNFENTNCIQLLSKHCTGIVNAWFELNNMQIKGVIIEAPFGGG